MTVDKTRNIRQERSRDNKREAGIKDIRIPANNDLRERFIAVPGTNHTERLEFLLNKEKLDQD